MLSGWLDFWDLMKKEFNTFLKKSICEKLGKHDYLFRFDKEISRIERGTVLYEKGDSFEVIMGFPKIRRAMVLDPTLKKHFSGLEKITVEEKMNGYNVRVAKVKDDILAITRSGYICPYTTEKAKEKLDLKFFDDFPELVLYGEMLGPDNPYVQKRSTALTPWSSISSIFGKKILETLFQ